MWQSCVVTVFEAVAFKLHIHTVHLWHVMAEVFKILVLEFFCGWAAVPATNIATGPLSSQLFGGAVEIHCAGLIHFKHDSIVQGTHITNTGMEGILLTWGKSLNKRWPAAVPESQDHVGVPLLTVVAQSLDYHNNTSGRSRNSQIVSITTAISTQHTLVTHKGWGLL